MSDRALTVFRGEPEESDDSNIITLDKRICAESVCSLLLQLPDVANFLYSESQEAKSMVQFLYQATDAEIQKVHQKIQDNSISCATAIQELYMACGNEFAVQRSQMACSEENQRVLLQMLQDARVETEKSSQVSSITASKVIQLYGAFESMQKALANLHQTVKQSEEKQQDKLTSTENIRAELTKKFEPVAQNYAAALEAFKDVSEKNDTNHKLIAEAEEVTKRLSGDMAKAKTRVTAINQTIAELQAELKRVETIAQNSQNAAFFQTTLESMNAEIQKLQANKDQLEYRLNRDGSIARGLRTNAKDVAGVSALLNELKGEVDELKVAVATLEGEKRILTNELAGLEAKFSNRVKELEQKADLQKATFDAALSRLEVLVRNSNDFGARNSPAPLNPNDTCQVFVTSAEMKELREKLRVVEDGLRASQPRAGSSRDSTVAETAHAITYAQQNARNRKYIKTGESSFLPLFTDDAAALKDLKCPYGYPYDLHDEFAPYITAVTGHTKKDLTKLREECESVAKQVFRPNAPRGDAFNEVVYGDDKQRIGELIVALEYGSTKEERTKIYSWFRRARVDTVTIKADDWKEEAAGKRAVKSGMAVGQMITLSNPLNF